MKPLVKPDAATPGQAQEAVAEPKPLVGGTAAEARATGVPPGMEPMGDDQVSPEEQMMYNQIVGQFAEFAYSEKGSAQIAKRLNKTGDPLYVNVARAHRAIADQIEHAAEQAGVELMADAVYHAQDEQINIIMEVGSAAGIMEMKEGSPEYQEVVELAFAETNRMRGEDMLNSGDRDEYMREAENVLAMQIGKEADSGQLAPNFQEAVAGIAANGNYQNETPAPQQEQGLPGLPS